LPFNATEKELEQWLLANLTKKERTGPWRMLYRILRPDESVKIGLVAKNSFAEKTVISHVNCGSKNNYKSQFISTTASLEVARYYKQKGEEKGLKDLRIAKIDLDKIPKGHKIRTTDLTIEANRNKYLGKAVCKNFAKKSEEVLLTCDTPIPFEVLKPEDENVIKSLKDEF
jgi:hypothetical protein